MTIKLPPKPEMAQIDRHIPTNYVIRGYTAEQMEAYALEAMRLNMAPLSDEEIVKAVAAERERWQQAAKAVIESHDAAITYLYERLRSQGVGSITIPDAAVAEIRAVNALRELVQPNTEAQGRQ